MQSEHTQPCDEADGEKQRFLDLVATAFDGGNFVRLTLGKYRGPGEALRAVVTPVTIKDKRLARIVTSGARNDRTENLSPDELRRRLGDAIGTTYLSATLFTTDEDATLSYSKKRIGRMVIGKPTFHDVPSTAHDRAKAHAVPPDRPYLAKLGVADGQGRIKPSMFGKYRQISRFIEIIDGLMTEAQLGETPSISIVDIGAGKGYLTFALYDHVSSGQGRVCRMTGIDVRQDLVDASNDLARSLDYKGLSFRQGQAPATSDQQSDIVIALHACDTATDDAIALGVSADARLIVTSPCCQHEIAPQLDETRGGLGALLHYPLFKQRQADLITDAARALLLEACGYAVKVIEFVSTEHTAKNILIAGVRSERIDRQSALARYRELKGLAGFAHHALETRLAIEKL